MVDSLRASAWKGLAAAILLGAVGAYVGAQLADAPDSLPKRLAELLGPAEVLILTFLGLVLPLALHEVGHLVAGLAVGFRFALFAAGPFMVSRDRDGLRFQLHRHYSLYGGVAACVPVGEKDLLRRMAWMTAGGPIASLLMAVVGVGGALWIDVTAPRSAFFLLVFGISGALNFLAVTVPATTGGFLTDRSRFLVLTRGGPAAARAAASAQLMARSLDGERPRDWPASAVDAVASAEGAEFDTLVGRLSYVVPFLQDTGAGEQSWREIQGVLDHVDTLPTILRPMVLFEAAFCAAHYAGDASRARELFERVPDKAFFEPYQRSRAEAAILVAEGALEGGRITARRALEELEKTLPSGASATVTDQLQALIHRESEVEPIDE